MTRQAVEAGFEQFVSEAIAATAQSFRVTAALQGTTGGPTGVVDRLIQDSAPIQHHVVEPTLADYQSDVLSQFDVILDYAQSDDEIEAFGEEILARDAYAEALRPGLSETDRQQIITQLLDRAERLGKAVVPLIETADDEFWPALKAAYTAEEAAAVVDTQFRFTRPIRDHPDAFEFATQIEPGELLDGFGGLGGLLGNSLPTMRLEFTHEAIRAMKRGEETVVEQTTRELRRQSESTGDHQ
jgi:hypothetical protein